MNDTLEKLENYNKNYKNWLLGLLKYLTIMNNGCIIQNYYREGLIVGLKEFDYDDDFMFKQNHLYFAHC